MDLPRSPRSWPRWRTTARHRQGVGTQKGTGIDRQDKREEKGDYWEKIQGATKCIKPREIATEATGSEQFTPTLFLLTLVLSYKDKCNIQDGRGTMATRSIAKISSETLLLTSFLQEHQKIMQLAYSREQA